MTQWIDIAPASDLPEGGKICAHAGKVPIAVFHVDGEIHAIKNICPHAGLPLADGEVRGKVLTCPFHGYAYRVDTGQNIDFPDHEQGLTRLAVRVTDGRIEVELESE